MLILLILCRSLRPRSRNLSLSDDRRVQYDPIAAMKAFLTGLAT
jgi:hypothetical protein